MTTPHTQQLHAGARLGPQSIPIAELRPHPLNSNVMPEDLRAKLAAHIKQSGR